MDQAPEKIPTRFPLKKSKCPDCKEDLSGPSWHASEEVVRVLCKTDDCGYAVDLMWITKAAVNPN
jgi:hypothetical protein